MYRHLIAVLALAALAAPATAAAQPPTVTVAGTHLIVYQPAGKPRARVLLFPGLDSTELMYEQQPFAAVRVGLLRQGYQVVVVANPYADQTPGVVESPAQYLRLQQAFTTDPSGLSYRRGYVRALDTIVRWTQTRLGRLPLLAAGISWGGLHAIEAVCQRPRLFSGWIALVPVIDPTKLQEFTAFPLSALQAQTCAPVLARVPGFFDYGTQDQRVGVAPSAALAALLAGSRVTVQPLAGGHDVPPESVAAMLAWSAKPW